MLHRVEGLSVRSKVKALYFGEVGVCQFLEDVSGFDGELHWPGVVRAQNLQNFLQADAISVDDGVVLELIDKLFLFGGVFEFVE